MLRRAVVGSLPSLSLRLQRPRLPFAATAVGPRTHLRQRSRHLRPTFGAAGAGLPPHLGLGPRPRGTRYLTANRSPPSWRS
jgi:hypothetical protein